MISKKWVLQLLEEMPENFLSKIFLIKSYQQRKSKLRLSAKRKESF